MDVDVVEACILALEKAGKVVDAKSCLICAGVEPTQAHVDLFAACVKKTGSFATLKMTPRGSLAYCAVAIAKDLAPEKAHTSSAFRDSLETWKRMWEAFVSKSEDAITGADDADVEKYRVQYNTRRATFVDNGGKTSTGEVDPARLIPVWVWWVGGVALVLYGINTVKPILSLLSKKP